MTMLSVGDPAPDFELPDQEGRPVRLSDFRRKTRVVLYFYPKDFTPICTREACRFRDRHDELLAAGAQVLGVSADPVGAHRQFASRHRLPFRVLSDPTREVHRLYGAEPWLGLLPRRITYVIDREGAVRLAVAARFSAALHVEEALKALAEL